MVKKIVLAVVAAVVLALGGGAAFVFTKKPNQRPAPDLKVEVTPEKVARGKYLAEHVAHCTFCHSGMDPQKFGMPPRPGTLGAGGACPWTEETGFPGTLCAPNITPDPVHGIGSWTDGEIVRAIREGVDKDGNALFPIMPYPEYAKMSDEDAEAIVAYLRSLPPVANAVPDRKLNPPLSFIVNFMPAPLTSAVAAPDRGDVVGYGKYLATMANCKQCHTPVDEQHEHLPGMEFAGGQEFKTPWNRVLSANISPHETGLKNWSREMFVAAFRAYGTPAAREIAVDPKDNTVMPWLFFAGMTEEDLGAVYDYLRTVKPVENQVPRINRAVPPAPQPEAPVEAAAATE